MCFLVFLRYIWRNRNLFYCSKYIVDRYVGMVTCWCWGGVFGLLGLGVLVFGVDSAQLFTYPVHQYR